MLSRYGSIPPILEGGGGHAPLQEALAELEVGLDDLRGHRTPELYDSRQLRKVLTGVVEVAGGPVIFGDGDDNCEDW